MGIVCIPTTFWLTSVHREVAFALEDRNSTHDEDIDDMEDADKDEDAGNNYRFPPCWVLILVRIQPDLFYL